MIRSLEPKLFYDSICSIRIRSRIWNIVKNPLASFEPNISIHILSRTVTRCLMEELDSSEIGVQVQYSLNPLLPPACVPFVELIGLEAGKLWLFFIENSKFDFNREKAVFDPFSGVRFDAGVFF